MLRIVCRRRGCEGKSIATRYLVYPTFMIRAIWHFVCQCHPASFAYVPCQLAVVPHGNILYSTAQSPFASHLWAALADLIRARSTPCSYRWPRCHLTRKSVGIWILSIINIMEWSRVDDSEDKSTALIAKTMRETLWYMSPVVSKIAT